MMIGENVGFGTIDWAMDALGQSITTQMAPGTAVPVPGTTIPIPAGSIPITQLGPVQITAANLAPIQGLTAAIRTPSRVVNVISMPTGVFQGSMDTSDFQQGATVVFTS